MKYLAVVKIVEPSEVEARYSHYDNGAVYVEVPEMGFTGDNLLYCRYGLSLPYFKVLVDDKVWIESTIGRDERWIYTGFADSRNDPDNGDYIIETFSGFTLKITEDGKLKLENDSGDDFVDLVKQFCEGITNMTTITALGPQAPVNLSTFTSLLTKFEGFVV